MSNAGWICPRCQKVHAPFVQSCECGPLPDLIGKPLPNPIRPLGPGWPEWPSDPIGYWPMPICGCTGPCGNVACPHLPKVTCGPRSVPATFGQFSIIATTNGAA